MKMVDGNMMFCTINPFAFKNVAVEIKDTPTWIGAYITEPIWCCDGLRFIVKIFEKGTFTDRGFQWLKAQELRTKAVESGEEEG